MIDFQKYKKSLGTIAQTLTDEEIDRRRVMADRIADVLFDIWLKKKNHNANLVHKTEINETESAI